MPCENWNSLDAPRVVPERVLRSDAIGTADIVAAESAIIVLLDVMAAVVATATLS